MLNADGDLNSAAKNDTNDVLICGLCRSSWSDINLFIQHKAGCRGPGDNTNGNQTEDRYLGQGTRPAGPASSSTAPLQPSDIHDLSLANDLRESLDTSRQINKKIHSRNHEKTSPVPIATFTPDLFPTKPSAPAKVVARDKRFHCTAEGCTYASSYPKDLQRHMLTHTGQRPFRCQFALCAKTFNRLDKLKTHERQHTGLKPFKCGTCDYAANDCSSLKKHSRIHTNERPYRCQICQYASRNSSQLTVHLRSHTLDAPFTCPHCPSTFKINSDLTRHLRLHSGEKPFACSICDFRCSIKGNLNNHVRINHSTENLRHCPQCEYATPSRKLLRLHVKTHVAGTVFRCPQLHCPYTSHSEALLRKHSLVHYVGRPYKCQHCPYTSRQSGNVRSHHKKRHPDKKLGRLKMSDATTASSDQTTDSPATDDPPPPNDESAPPVSRQPRAPSTNRQVLPQCVRAFQCTECTAAFVRADSLRSHVRQHQRTKLNAAAATIPNADNGITKSEIPSESYTVNSTAQMDTVVSAPTYRTPCELLLAAAAACEPPGYQSAFSQSALSSPQAVEHDSTMGHQHVNNQQLPVPTTTVLCFQSGDCIDGHTVHTTSGQETIVVSGGGGDGGGAALLDGGAFSPSGNHTGSASQQLLYHLQSYRPAMGNVVHYVVQAGPTGDCGATTQFVLSAGSPLATSDGGGMESSGLVYVPGHEESLRAFYQVAPSPGSTVAPQLINYVVANDVVGMHAAGADQFVGAMSSPAGYAVRLVEDSQRHQPAVVLCGADCQPSSHSTVVYTASPTTTVIVDSANH